MGEQLSGCLLFIAAGVYCDKLGKRRRRAQDVNFDSLTKIIGYRIPIYAPINDEDTHNFNFLCPHAAYGYAHLKAYC